MERSLRFFIFIIVFAIVLAIVGMIFDTYFTARVVDYVYLALEVIFVGGMVSMMFFMVFDKGS